MSLLEPTVGDLSLDWVRRRIEWLRTVEARAWDIDVLPDELHNRIHEHATEADLRQALSTLETVSEPGLVAEATAYLIEWIDPGAPAITDAIVRFLDDPIDDWRAGRLLRLRGLSWDQCFARARSLAEQLPGSSGVVSGLVQSMLPTFWSGSRVPHLERALREVEGWFESSASGELRRAARDAIRDLEEMLDSERERERRQDIRAGGGDWG